MPRVIIDQDITPTDRLLNQLPNSWETEVGIKKEGTRLQPPIAENDIAFVTSRVPVSSDDLGSASNLKVIGKLGTGIDSVNVAAARECGVTVTHTPGHNALSVAEHAIGLTLATTRHLTAARNLITEGRWRDEYELGSRFSGSTVGLIGIGNVGKRVGTLLSGFDVEILAYDPYIPEIDTDLFGGELASLDTLLRESDVVILTAELTDETHGMIGEHELSLMDSSSILINIARGSIVQTDALLNALYSGSIGGAGLDVFATEPLEGDSELLELDNVVATPHIAAMTAECRDENIDQLAKNVTRLMAGEPVHDRYIATADE